MLLATCGLIRPAVDQGRIRLDKVEIGSVVYPASFSTGTGALSSGLRCSGLESNHSPPSSAVVSKNWSCSHMRAEVRSRCRRKPELDMPVVIRTERKRFKERLTRVNGRV